MQSLIVKYLWVTGIGAAVVLAVPSLVLIGLFALILPGLVLAMLPTAFAYGAVFALAWFPLHRAIGDWPAAALSAALTFALFWALPAAGNADTRARYLAELADDVKPAAPVALRGDIRLESRTTVAGAGGGGASAAPSPRRAVGTPPDYAKAECPALCAALLFTEGVTSVTVDYQGTNARGVQPASARAVTFRLVPRDRCAATLEPSFKHNQFGDGPLRALEDAWALRLSTTDCIVAGPPLPSAVTDADVVVVASRSVDAQAHSARATRWSLGPRPVGVDRLELFDRAGKTLLRHTVARARRITQPLVIAPEGGLDNFHFQLASKSLGGRWEGFDATALLAAHTTLDVRAGDDPELAGRVRRRLAQLLDDPRVPATDPGFGLVERFLKAMAADGAPDDDVALLTRLIGDDRVTRFDGLWQVARKAAPRLEPLRAPIVARLRRADPSREAGLRTLGAVLDALPAGAFATLRRDEAELMADLDRHRFAHAIIGRQADRGAESVPLLTRILDAQARRHAALVADRKARSADEWRKESARDGIDGVRIALCRLGPAGSGALPTIEALERERVLFERRMDDAWQLTLVRLGRPVEAIPKPASLSGTEEQFHARLRRKLERFDAARDCGS